MSQTLIFDAYTAYLALIATALPSVTVYDGPQVTHPTDSAFVIVGTDDPTATGFSNSVDNGQQDWEDLGAFKRLETFDIWSTLVVWSGDSDLAALRATGKTHLTAIASALRPPPAGTGDGMLGGVLNQAGGGVGWCGLYVSRLRQIQSQEGSAIHLPFALTCTARV